MNVAMSIISLTTISYDYLLKVQFFLEVGLYYEKQIG